MSACYQVSNAKAKLKEFPSLVFLPSSDVGINHVCQQESDNSQSKIQPAPLSKHVVHHCAGYGFQRRGSNKAKVEKSAERYGEDIELEA